jgi:hypothetical protein
MKPSKLFVLIGGVVACLIVILLLSNLIAWNDAGVTTIVQYPTGRLMVKSTPGPYGLWWGHSYKYRQVMTVAFGSQKKGGSADIPTIPVIFNTGAKAMMSGLVRIELPRNDAQMIKVLEDYAGGQDHFISSGVVPVVQNAVKLSANLISEQEAYTTLASFQQYISDQLSAGIYKTKSVEKWIVKETGDSERVKITQPVQQDNGDFVRSATALQQLGCKVQHCQIEVPDFDGVVENAINERKKRSLETEIAKQQAIKAKQDAITAAANAEAMVATERAKKEVEKVSAVVKAEQMRDVSKLEKEAAEYTKQKLILEGEGEATKKRLVMQANGALEQKLDAYKEVQGLWAKAFAEGYRVPNVMMGGGANGSLSAFDQAMQSITLKQMKDLGLDMTMKQQ